MDSTGQRSASAVDRNATSVPADSDPSATCTTPTTSAAPIASSGSVTMTAQMDASSRALRSSVPRSVCDSSWKARAWLRCRPNPLMIRMPSTLSSTTVVRSPTWSCARRATAEYFFSKIPQVIITGMAGPRITSPSVQSWTSMMPTPTRIVTPLTSRNVSGKARNIRSSIRSVVPRESNWPCLLYRDSSPNSSASATPRSSRYRAPSHTPAGSRSATGPSTIHFRTSGITRPTQEARIAMTAALANRARTGRTYGHSRSRARTVERFSAGRSGAGAGVVGISSEPTVHH